MIGLYLVFAILGLLIFVLSIFGWVEHDFAIDHHFDLGHHGDFGHHGADDQNSSGLFSIRTISAFLAGFGTAGLIAKLGLGWGMGGQLFLGFATGIFFGAIAFGIMKIMYDQQAGKVRDANSFIGKDAVVTTATTSQGIGECRVENSYYTFREKNNIPLKLNDICKVTAYNAGALTIEKQ